MVRLIVGRLMLWAMRRYFLGREIIVVDPPVERGPAARHRVGIVEKWEGHHLTIHVPNRLLGGIGRVDVILGHFSKLRRRDSPIAGMWWEFRL